MSSALCFLHFSPLPVRHNSPPSSIYPFPVTIRPFSALSRSFPTNACLSPTNADDIHMVEGWWLREEQRWLREEQRWLREEKRWNNERECLLREISELRLMIKTSENQDYAQDISLSEALEKIRRLIQILKDGDSEKLNMIAETGSGPKPIVFETEEIQEAEDVKVKKVVGPSETRTNNMVVNISKKVSLRKGSEGEDVQAMQEALQNLGFYSGEEDMEFSSFASGTESAVMTWQASIGAPEDGIMSADLLERLYMGQTTPDPSPPLGGSTKILKTPQSVGVDDLNVSRERVFLLGENRWEEEAFKFGGNKVKDNETKCIACRGERRLLCMECDGTGEPNIEPQFVEWVDENLKCPYCNGVGYTICDVCKGNM